MPIFKKKFDNYNKYARLFPAKIQNRILLEAVSKISGPKLVDYLKQLNKEEAKEFYNKYPDIKARLNNPLKNKIYPSLLKKAALLTPVFWFGMLPKHEQAKYMQRIKDNLPWNKRKKTQQLKTKTELKSSGIKQLHFDVGNQNVITAASADVNTYKNQLKKIGFIETGMIKNNLDYGQSSLFSVKFNKNSIANCSIRTGEKTYIYVGGIDGDKVVEWCKNNKKLLDAFDMWGERSDAFKIKDSLNKIKQKVTSSYSYKGVVVNASCKEEAIAVFAGVEAFSEGMRKVIAGHAWSPEEFPECREYLNEFNKYWIPKINEFKNKANQLKNISYSVWLTDCDDDVNKFAEWGYVNGFKVKELPIALDWCITNKPTNKDERKKLNLEVSSLVNWEIYDNIGEFWRDDNGSPIDFDDWYNDLKKVNDYINKYWKK